MLAEKITQRPSAAATSQFPYEQALADKRTARRVLSNFEVDLALAFPSAEAILHQISGLSMMLAKAHHDADAISENCSVEVDPSLVDRARPVLMARSLGAINTLANLAIFFGEGRS